jgi:hypothetical protein
VGFYAFEYGEEIVAFFVFPFGVIACVRDLGVCELILVGF